MTAPGFGGPPPAGGRGAVGTGGLLVVVVLVGGFAAIGGVGVGLVFTAIGGGCLTVVLAEKASEPAAAGAGVFFQGTAVPFPGAIPGKTATGLASALAIIEESFCIGVFVAGAGLGAVAALGFGALGGGLFTEGGGTFGFEGTSSR